MHDILDDSNFVLFAAKHYDNPHCHDTSEFYDDLKRFKYIKRLIIKYKDRGELKERLILNHIIILYNVFGPAATRMLFMRLEGYHQYVKPFVVLLGQMPEKIVTNKVYFSSDIPMDQKIVEVLRKI